MQRIERKSKMKSLEGSLIQALFTRYLNKGKNIGFQLMINYNGVILTKDFSNYDLFRSEYNKLSDAMKQKITIPNIFHFPSV